MVGPCFWVAGDDKVLVRVPVYFYAMFALDWEFMSANYVWVMQDDLVTIVLFAVC